MDKIKIFTSKNSHPNLEKNVNNWIENNRGCRIKSIKIAQSGRLDINVTLIIWYTIG